jgi:hypothetical protein
MKTGKISAGILWASLLAVPVLFHSCSKILEKEPEVTLVSDQVYRNVFDADAAVIGVYGKVMGLAKQYVVLNELRADLTEVTDNADASLKEISLHAPSAGNPYADPRPIYAVIVQCNDVLKNFRIMLAEQKFKDVEFNQRYSDIGAIRSWLYLQLGIHYGQVPYVTDALENLDAVRDQSKYPILPFNTLLDSLISFTQSLPAQVPYPAGTSLVLSVDGSLTQSMFIEKNSLMGDLNLWRGNYTAAATHYRKLLESTGYNVGAGSEQFYQQFRIPYASVTNNNDLAVGYIRFKESDINSLIENNSQGWRSMFARGQDALWTQEWIWVLPFNSNFSPANPFIDLFSNMGGRYQLKPSMAAVDNWNSQRQSNGFPFDARGNFSWKTLNGQPVIMKYLYNYLNGTTLVPTNVLQKNGQWFLNRAAAIHLKFAEAANRDRRNKLAYALVNNGIGSTYDTSSASGRDVTNLQNTLFDAAPYNFDARNGEYPRYRGDWYRNAGIRGRARVVALPVTGDSTLAIEDMIINESALELAYEGYRWPDLLRIALRRNNPAFLADKIYANAAAVRAKLMTPTNWYLPFKMK